MQTAGPLCGVALLAAACVSLAGGPAAAAGPSCAARPVSSASDDLGVKVCVSRPAPVYARNEAVELVITTAQPVIIEIWMLDTTGALTPLLPAEGETLRVAPGQPLRISGKTSPTLKVGGRVGDYELRIIARPPRGSIAKRGLGDAGSLAPGGNVREDHRLTLTVR